MKATFVLLFTLGTSFTVFCQKELKEAARHFRDQNYLVAGPLFQKAFDKDSTNLEAAHSLGVCYLYNLQDISGALKYLQKAEPEFTNDGQFNTEMAMAYFYNLDFDKALEYLQKGKNLTKKANDVRYFAQYEAMIENAKKYYRSPLDVSLINLGKGINSNLDELTPIIDFDGKNLFFTTNNKFDRTFMVYTYDVNITSDDDGVFDKAKPLSPISTVEDEWIAGYSANDGKVIAQFVGYEAYQDLGFSEPKGKAFSGKIYYDQNINSPDIETSAFETSSGDTLFFASNRPGGMGGFDIYLAIKLPNGEYGEPTNLGAPINTEYDEEFPIISRDGKSFYFASNNTNSMGGYDIFVSKISADKQFSEPKNLGYPINDVFDNKTIAFDPDNRYAYISTVRHDSFGGYDLYRVIFNEKDPSVRIYLVEMFTQKGDQKTPVNATDSVFQISVIRKGDLVFGEYAYNKQKNQATIALPPGNYTLEIQNQNFKKFTKKISVSDLPDVKKIMPLQVILEPKE